MFQWGLRQSVSRWHCLPPTACYHCLSAPLSVSPAALSTLYLLPQEYFLKLLGRYRDFIMPEDVYRAAAAAASVSGRRDSGTGVLPSPRAIRARPSFRHTSSVSSRLRGEPDDDDSLMWGPGSVLLQFALQQALPSSDLLPY